MSTASSMQPQRSGGACASRLSPKHGGQSSPMLDLPRFYGFGVGNDKDQPAHLSGMVPPALATTDNHHPGASAMAPAPAQHHAHPPRHHAQWASSGADGGDSTKLCAVLRTFGVGSVDVDRSGFERAFRQLQDIDQCDLAWQLLQSARRSSGLQSAQTVRAGGKNRQVPEPSLKLAEYPDDALSPKEASVSLHTQSIDESFDSVTSPGSGATRGGAGGGRRTVDLKQFRFGAPLANPATSLSSSMEESTGITPNLARSSRIRLKSHDAHGYEVLNDYTILDEIGSGASGTVMLALHSRTQEPFAVKAVAKPRKLKFGRALPAFDIEREVAVMKKLRHPHIVQLHEVIDDPDEHMIYLVMDYVPNGPCAHGALDAATGRWRFDVVQPEERLVRLARQIAEGLRYLHKRGIVHRDVKPDNLLLDACDNVKIADFGISEFRANARCDGEAGLRANPLRGSYAFMSPEACRGDPMGPASDIWSLGITLFAMKFGFLPFDKSDSPTTVCAVLNEELPIPPECSSSWRDLFSKMLEKDDASRISLRAVLQHPLLDSHSKQAPAVEVDDASEIGSEEDADAVPDVDFPNLSVTARSETRLAFFSAKYAADVNRHRHSLGFHDELDPLVFSADGAPLASPSHVDGSVLGGADGCLGRERRPEHPGNVAVAATTPPRRGGGSSSASSTAAMVGAGVISPSQHRSRCPAQGGPPEPRNEARRVSRRGTLSAPQAHLHFSGGGYHHTQT